MTWPIYLLNGNTLGSSKKKFQIVELPGLWIDCTQILKSLSGELKQEVACSGGYIESQSTVLKLKNMDQPAQTLLQIAASLNKIRQQIHFNKVNKVLETVVLFCAKAYLTAQKHRRKQSQVPQYQTLSPTCKHLSIAVQAASTAQKVGNGFHTCPPYSSSSSQILKLIFCNEECKCHGARKAVSKGEEKAKDWQSAVWRFHPAEQKQNLVLLTALLMHFASDSLDKKQKQSEGAESGFEWKWKWPLCFLHKSMLSVFVRHAQRTLESWGSSGIQADFQQLPFIDLKYTKAFLSAAQVLSGWDSEKNML